MRLSFNELAERELLDTAQYYEHESRGLGVAFLDDIEHACRDIAQFPHAAPTVLDPVRRRLLRRFPYALLYSIRGDEIRVLAVMNLKRHPKYWTGRD